MADLELGLADARRLLDGFGLHVRRVRKALNLTVRDLGELVGERPDIITRIENGYWMPTEEVEQKLRHWMLQHSQASLSA